MNDTYSPSILLTHPQYHQSTGLTKCILQLAHTLHHSGYTVLLVISSSKLYTILTYPSLAVAHDSLSLHEVSTVIHPDLVISVSWHTWSHTFHHHFTKLSIPCIFWSHGTSVCVFFSLHPFLSLVRAIRKLHHYLYIFSAVASGSCLVVAYKPTTLFDSRSTDYFIARLLHKRVVVLPNPVDTSLWHPSATTQARSTLVTQSRLEWQKGFPRILDILNSPDLNHLTYHWITTSSLSSLTSTPPIAPTRVQFFQDIPTERRIHLLSTSLCYISFSQTEYQSLSILEALSCGIPVISSRTGWTKTRQIPGVLLADDITQVKAHITTLCRDKTLWNTLSIEARHFAIQYHSTQTFSSAWTQLVSSYLK